MAKARLYFDGDNSGIEKEARTYSLTQEVEDKLDSISDFQDDIDDLQDQINNLASRGRYLSTWDCVTGLPGTDPQVDPYVYRAGDYYIVSNVGGTNLRPTGAEYHAQVPSQVIESQSVSVNDLYIYDGIQWVLQGSGSSIYAVWGSIAGTLSAQTDLQTALDAKANKTDVLEKTNTTAFTPTGDYNPATKKYVDDEISNIDLSTKQDKLTAGNNIQISNTNVISATDTVYSAGENVNIECPIESDMQGPCPSGFHVPTKNEIDSLVGAMITTLGLPANLSTAKTYLKMPPAGTRRFDTGNSQLQGFYGTYLTCSPMGGWAHSLELEPNGFRTGNTYYSMGSSVRPFKNTPIVPDNTWTTLYDGSSVATLAGIFHNTTEGLISISGDGATWITMADKNLGATVLYNDGDSLSQSNCGGYFQWGNNYMFPFSGGVTTSSVLVDTTGYGPGNYYYSNVFIFGTHEHPSWSSLADDNLRGGQTQSTWQDCEHPIISAEGTKMVVLSYGHSTWQDFIDAYNKNAIVYCKASSQSNPGSGNQGRMAFMAFVDINSTTGDLQGVEFQYYRSRSSHSTAATVLDEVYIYKLTSNGAWSVTQRDTAAEPIAGTGIGLTYNASGMTISADTSVLATQTDLSGKANATDVNTKTFNLASNQDLSTAQAAYDWWAAGGTPIISLGGTWLMRTLYSATVYSNSTAELQFVATNTRRDDVGGPTGGYTEFCSYFTSIRTDSTGTVTSVTGGETRNIKTLDPTYDYPTPYTPQYNGSPATKKYVDDSVIARVDATSPVSPLVGQLWYDTANSQLKLYDGSNRVSI